LVGKPPVPGDYKMMRMGLAVLSPQAVALGTMQFDDPDKPPATEMLSLFSSIRFTSSGKAPEAAEGSSVLKIKKVGDFYELSVPVSRLILKIPAQGLVHSTTRIGGSTDNPRYFELMRPSPNLIVSGWFESGERHKGIKEFWAGESSALSRSGLPAPRNVEFLKLGSWDIVSYELRITDSDKLANANLRAELVQAGTWIDLHLSVTGPLSAQDARDQMLAAVKTMIVTELPP
ncbi:MAG: hypothetical protein JWM35_1003, partial [Verrucomicrobia bacterium]|nr:hypothetical protein [Verrucomicrobiota bacterium]